MAADLAVVGPIALGDLLDVHGCGPADWDLLEEWERASTRMAVRVLFRDHGVRVTAPDGLLYLPRRRAAPTWARLWRTPA
jgi:hypothetical protein